MVGGCVGRLQERPTQMIKADGSVHNVSTYTNYGCRCVECTRANAAVRERRRLERYAYTAEHGLPPEVEHGVSSYTNWGCRCEVCTTANTEACAGRRQRRRR